MCGIAGLWQQATQSKKYCEDAVRAMTPALVHRGPDDAGLWVDLQIGLALGHRRLSILDLSSTGHQPMDSAHGRYVIAFNGEIYNHFELRQCLESEGHASVWRGHSDTETLLAGIESWGLAGTLKRCTGMFAFALWDRKKRELHLVRDRMGEKPLYFGWVGGAFAFASELKALRRLPGFDNPVDTDALALYMEFGYVPAPHCIWRGLYKLLPGTVLTVSSADVAARSLPSLQTWWSVSKVAQAGLVAPIESEADAITSLEAMLKEVIRSQMVADVPLGALLSGGVDSSTIVSLMQVQSSRPVQTFTIGLDESEYDEAPYAAAVAKHLGTDHHEIRVTPVDAQAVIPTLPDLYDEPFADSSQIPTFLICAAARRNVIVALSGDGGDELFGGYNRYFWGRRIWRSIRWLPFSLRSMFGKIFEAMPAATWDVLGGLAGGVAQPGDKARKLSNRLQRVRGDDDLYRSLVTEWPTDSHIVRSAGRGTTLLDDPRHVERIADHEQRMMLWDMLTYLPDDILVKVDRAAMAVSLETRAPFLDHRIVEFAWRLPLDMKIRDGKGKWALRQVLDKHVPRNLIERPKAGFAIPLGQWLRGPLREWAEQLLAESCLTAHGHLDPEPIRLRWDQHLNERHDWTASLWHVLMFQSWLERQIV